MLELNDDHFMHRYVLYAHEDVVYHVDYSRTVAFVLFGEKFDRFVQATSRRVRSIGFLSAVVVSMYWLLILAIPDVMIHPLFVIIWTIGFIHNVVSLFRMQFDIVLLCFQTFEIVFLTFLVVVMSITLGSMTKWPVHMVMGSPFIIVSYLNTFLLDAWPISFSNFQKAVAAMTENPGIGSSQVENNQTQHNGMHMSVYRLIIEYMKSRIFPRAKGLKVHVMKTDAVVVGEVPTTIVSLPLNHLSISRHNESNMQGRQLEPNIQSNSVSSLHSTLFIYQSLSKRYAKVCEYISQGSVLEKMKRKFHASTSPGVHFIYMLLISWLVTIVLYAYVRWDCIAGLKDHTVAGMADFTTASVIFRACCLNTLAFITRRLGLQLFYPYKVLCVKQRPVKIPLVQEWLPVIHFIRSQRSTRAKQLHHLSANSSSRVSNEEPEEDFVDDEASKIVELKKSEQKVYKVHVFDEKDEGEDLPAFSRSVAISLNINCNKEHSHTQRQWGPFYRKGIILGPLQEEQIVDFSKDIFQRYNRSLILQKIFRGRGIAIALTTPSVLAATFLSIMINLPGWKIPHAYLYIVYIMAFINQLIVFSTYSTDALLKNSQRFDCLLLSFNSLIFVLSFHQYYGSKHDFMLIGIIYLELSLLTIIYLDAHPLPFSKAKRMLKALTSELNECKVLSKGSRELFVLGCMLEARLFDPQNDKKFDSNKVLNIRQKDLKSELSIPTFGSFYEWRQRKRPMFDLQPRVVVPIFLLGTLWQLAFFFVVQQSILQNTSIVTFDMFFFDYDNRSVICSSAFANILFFSRKLWGFIKDPIRCVSSDRRSVRMPLIPELLS